MDVSVRNSGSVVILDLSGKLSIGQGDVLLRQRVTELFESGRVQILINLERVSSMDSSGLGELVACYRRALAAGGAVKLLKPNESVSGLLAHTKLDVLFDVYSDERVALAAY